MDKIVLFDWGGVIESHKNGEYNIRTAVVNLMKKYGCKLPDDEIIKIYSKCDELKYNMSVYSDSSHINEWFEGVKIKLGLNCDLDDFIKSYYEDYKKIHYYKDVVDYAHNLKEKCKIGIFSNLMIIDEKRIDAQVDLKKFNYVFLSFKIGHRKPEDEAYEIVEQTTNIEPENMLFIDDSKENLEVAKQRGWKTCNAFGYELDKIKEAVDKFLK